MNSKQFSRRDFLKLGGSLATASLLAACQPGEETSTAPLSPTTSANDISIPEPAVSLPPVSLAILALGRMTFGIRPGDIEAFNALGSTDDERLRAFVQQQLNPDSLDDSDFESRYSAAGFQALHKSHEQLYSDHIANNAYDANDDAYWEWYSLPAYELVDATLLRAVFSKKQLVELLADFWHNHFNIFFWQDDGVPLLVSYNRDVLRRHMLGNFRQMLEAVASHPSMLYYLNQNNSSDAGPNENFARELFELHTLGAENYLGVRDPNTVEKDANGIAIGYVDNDVYEAARCLTGWRIDDDLGEWEEGVGITGNFIYYKPWHDRFNKLVLGKYIPADQPDMQDGKDVLDLLAAHPGTARHIARKLCRRFIADLPPDSVVEKVAAAFTEFRDAPDQLKRVMEVLLLSDEFKQSWGQKIKRPLEACISTLRSLNSDFTRVPGGVPWMLSLMGQPLFERRSPDGYPDVKEAWANSMSLLYRWNFAVGVAENWLNDDDKGLTLHTDLLNQTPAEIRTAESLADFWIQRILGRPLSSDADRNSVIAVMAQEYGTQEPLPEDHVAYVLPAMVEVILMSPDFQWK
ncbi:MAG TPA: DUF1800 family protein [Anaerolineales bacterium]|nr:DUF1800 family protein [Anaerolineales bacterium]HMV97306.1 DUF1800 family protein [Anaerolineales bacterium]HMX73707.1 DUF1800 family protein [Anaerolineales bacterium]HNC88345.1 DUF1800 family protein [Anaerolineales bacterium]HND90845.1 DUF1800 family protein [Anaerolineales bacterium]